MPSVLDNPQAGLTVDEMVTILADEFGARVANTKFSNDAIRQINRALLMIQQHNPQIRAFTVHDGEVTLQDGVAVYDVTQDVENGGWGWTKCTEVLTVFVSALSPYPMEMVKLDQWRRRGEATDQPGIPETCVVLDQKRVRIFPTPQADATGTGDYRQDVPTLPSGATRVDWPAGWDNVALMGAEWLMSRFRRPEMVPQFKDDFDQALDKIRRGENLTGVRPRRAVATRNIRGTRTLPHDNSMDWRNR